MFEVQHGAIVCGGRSLVRIGRLRLAAKSLFAAAHIELIDVWALSFESLEREEEEAVSEDHKERRGRPICLYIL